MYWWIKGVNEALLGLDVWEMRSMAWVYHLLNGHLVVVDRVYGSSYKCIWLLTNCDFSKASSLS